MIFIAIALILFGIANKAWPLIIIGLFLPMLGSRTRF